MKERIKEVAIQLFKSVLLISTSHQGTFRLIVSVSIDNATKPLLLVGNAHSEVEDGHCIAILNPEESLMGEVVAGCTYMGNTLKNIVRGKCDAMVDLWIDAYKKDGVIVISSYTSREPKSARFKVK